VRHLAGPGQLAAAHLVQYPAGLLVPEVVTPPALQFRQGAQGAVREALAEADRLDAVMSVSRPNRVRNQGSPAAGSQTVLSDPFTCIRSADRSAAERRINSVSTGESLSTFGICERHT
jgi:hypothetical protein